MALSICNAIMDSDNTTSIAVLLRALNSLDLCLDDPVYRDELKTLTVKVREVCFCFSLLLFIFVQPFIT